MFPWTEEAASAMAEHTLQTIRKLQLERDLAFAQARDMARQFNEQLVMVRTLEDKIRQQDRLMTEVEMMLRRCLKSSESVAGVG